MSLDDINEIIEFIKEQTDFKGDIFININKNAIPIEWIWKWYDEETHRLGDGWTHVEHPYSIKRMIEDWEKENENL